MTEINENLLPPGIVDLVARYNKAKGSNEKSALEIRLKDIVQYVQFSLSAKANDTFYFAARPKKKH